MIDSIEDLITSISSIVNKNLSILTAFFAFVFLLELLVFVDMAHL